MGKNKLGMLIYSLALIVISAVITTFIMKYIVLGSFTGASSSAANNEIKQFTEVSAQQVATSPIKSDKDVIEIFSYGCHYCASYEGDFAKLESQLPEGSHLVRLHLNVPRNGLARYAPIFATLSVMGLEEKLREKAYYAVMIQKSDLSDQANLNEWLKNNDVDVNAFNEARNSPQVRELLNYMQAVATHYNIKATPMFIVGKKYVVVREQSAEEFTKQVLDLLQKQ